jgi:putative endopeptidase
MIFINFNIKNMSNLTTRFIIILFFLCFSTSYSQVTDKYFLDENIDFSVNPDSDFFMFANGEFIKNHPIPPSESSYGIFNLVEDSVYVYLQRICEDAMSKTDAVRGSNTDKIGGFYFSGLDTNNIEKQDIAPLKKWFDEVDNIANTNDLMNVISEMHTYGMGPLFGFYVGQDLMQSDIYKMYLYQGGIGLPDRDYYFNEDGRTTNIRNKYIEHIDKMMGLIGEEKSTAIAKMIFELEKKLAKASRKLEDLRDDYANYNKMTLKEFNSTTPSIDWKKVFEIYGIKNTDTLVIGQPEFFKEVETLLNYYDITDWKSYLKWNLISYNSSLLSNKFVDQNFDFYGRTLSGTTEQRPRWKRVLDNTNRLLGEILGMEYVKLYFPPEDKVRTKELVNNMVDAFAERIKKLDWMTDKTKEKALQKLGSLVKKIGYPDKWKDYSSMEIKRDSYVLNVLNANHWHFNDNVSKLGKPVDRTEWDMNPQTYNAYYNPSNNEIVLPAAILTIPGKKMSEVDDAFLYGFIGASTIGHEMTHGFDDQGRLYDASGNLNGWWTSDDSIKFVQKTKLMVEQYNNYKVLDSMHVNGKATLGENIADLGGLVIGYDAMKKSADGQQNQKIGRFTADQRYFLGYAFSWAMYYRPETLARKIMTDVHSPAYLRVNGPVSNMTTFYNAFDVKDTDPLYRGNELRVEIW